LSSIVTPLGCDENLQEIATGRLPHVERDSGALKPLLHAGKIAAPESD
jgi:hypothetical protein